ncbi:MAG: hypothetical protein JNK06_08705 [Candidatus Accumulibacter phosphatis]|uniref:hypothetical protein n=1 Tax=Candidatus Accumulibacter phosphatis TaxID=327160 RepID=UPI001A456A2C|nr:hypothetical protein [Candidatus Accumulibacter phosphatis]
MHQGDAPFPPGDGTIHRQDETVRVDEGKMHPIGTSLHRGDESFPRADATIDAEDGTMHRIDASFHGDDGSVSIGDGSAAVADGPFLVGQRTLTAPAGTLGRRKRAADAAAKPGRRMCFAPTPSAQAASAGCS